MLVFNRSSLAVIASITAALKIRTPVSKGAYQ